MLSVWYSLRNGWRESERRMETRVFGLLQTQTDRLLKAITKSNAVNYPVTLLLFFLLFRGGLWEVTSPPMPPALPWTMGRPCNLCTNYTSLGTHWSPPTSERTTTTGRRQLWGCSRETDCVPPPSFYCCWLCRVVSRVGGFLGGNLRTFKGWTHRPNNRILSVCLYICSSRLFVGQMEKVFSVVRQRE